MVSLCNKPFGLLFPTLYPTGNRIFRFICHYKITGLLKQFMADGVDFIRFFIGPHKYVAGEFWMT